MQEKSTLELDDSTGGQAVFEALPEVEDHSEALEEVAQKDIDQRLEREESSIGHSAVKDNEIDI